MRIFGVQGGKLLRLMLTHRGIEVNPDKCKAIIQMKTGLFSLERQVREGISRIQAILSLAPILTRSTEAQDLYLYLAISEHAISVVIVQEDEGKTMSDILYQHNIAGHRNSIPNDRETSLHPRHLGQTTLLILRSIRSKPGSNNSKNWRSYTSSRVITLVSMPLHDWPHLSHPLGTPSSTKS
ncbi:hypothetical protein CR513_53843, partial [Mucuna pruriens]